MENLLTAWSKVIEQFKKADHVLLLLDYDGTLTPIVGRPEEATLSDDMRQLLQALAHQNHLRVGIISGRALTDLKNKVKIDNIIYAGNHGLEIEGPGVRFVNPLAEEIRPVIRIITQVLERTLNTIKGVVVEDKGLTLSVHYRQVDEDKATEVKDTFNRVVGGAEAIGQVRVTTGKKVYEVRPAADWDKGKAIKLLMRKYGKGGRESGLLPVYLGDDLTDEDGFKVIGKYGNGISILVSEVERETAACYFLKSPAEVGRFLNLLLEQAKRGLRSEF
ncbi:MAG: trehalose-phosphatase [Chloroflexota bacterium]